MKLKYEKQFHGKIWGHSKSTFVVQGGGGP